LERIRETVCRIIRLKGYMGVTKQNRARTLAGWLCLLAAVALYAPLGAAAFLAHGMACCSGDHCPIKQHHHPKKPLPQRGEMDCGHDLSLTSCSMACCDDSEKPVVTPVAFVVPAAQAPITAGLTVRFVDSKKEVAIVRSIVPLSPPPQASAL
jgi:hypothetical protein